MTRFSPRVATFSIVGHDPDERSWGVAVASRFLGVGGLVPWARGGVGAVATQSLANMGFGPDGLDLMEAGRSAQETLDRLLEQDEQAPLRQVGMVDQQGRAATFTGVECIEWAGGITGQGYAIQGNILTGPDVVENMEKAFLSAAGELGDRLYAALAAGDQTGGDKRGKQSAALYVAKPHGSYGGTTDRYIDLRVDDHADPVTELGRLLRMHRLYLGTDNKDEHVPFEGDAAHAILERLAKDGLFSGDPAGGWNDDAQTAFENFVYAENLEERVDLQGRTLHPMALDYIKGTL